MARRRLAKTLRRAVGQDPLDFGSLMTRCRVLDEDVVVLWVKMVSKQTVIFLGTDLFIFLKKSAENAFRLRPQVQRPLP